MREENARLLRQLAAARKEMADQEAERVAAMQVDDDLRAREKELEALRLEMAAVVEEKNQVEEERRAAEVERDTAAKMRKEEVEKNQRLRLRLDKATKKCEEQGILLADISRSEGSPGGGMEQEDLPREQQEEAMSEEQLNVDMQPTAKRSATVDSETEDSEAKAPKLSTMEVPEQRQGEVVTGASQAGDPLLPSRRWAFGQVRRG